MESLSIGSVAGESLFELGFPVPSQVRSRLSGRRSAGKPTTVALEAFSQA